MRRVTGGDALVAHIPEDAVHVFDGASGEALHNRSLAEEDVADVATD